MESFEHGLDHRAREKVTGLDARRIVGLKVCVCRRWVAEPGAVGKYEDEDRLRSWVVGEKQWQWGLGRPDASK